MLLFDRDSVVALLERQEAVADSLKQALITNDPTRIATLYPAYAPQTNAAAVEALDTGAPVEIITEVDSGSAEDFLRRLDGGELSMLDLDGMLTPGSDF